MLLSELLASPFFEHGFLEHPAPEPAPGTGRAHWESALARAVALPLQSEDASPAAHAWREAIREMPVHPLPAAPHHGRAHSTLAFLANLYAHSLPPTAPESAHALPASLAVPLLHASLALGVPPGLSYAATVLHNLCPRAPLTHAHARVRATFTGTPDEAHFYAVSARIECVGARALGAVRDALALRAAAQSPAAPLRRLAADIRAMAGILDGVRAGCDPGAYYSALRPWMRAPGGAAGGWALALGEANYDEVSSRVQGEAWVQHLDRVREELVLAPLAGATAAQSPLVQALDAALGLDHAPGGFLHQMRAYIPRAQREFIEALEGPGRALRERIVGAEGDEEAREAYNACVAALAEMRSVHVRIATLYLVNQAPRGAAAAAVLERGTGGSAAIPFLKGVRDRTLRAAV